MPTQGDPHLRAAILRTLYWVLAWGVFVAAWALIIPYAWKPLTAPIAFAIVAAGVLRTWLRYAKLRRSGLQKT